MLSQFLDRKKIIWSYFCKKGDKTLITSAQKHKAKSVCSGPYEIMGVLLSYCSLVSVYRNNETNKNKNKSQENT